MQEGNCWAWRGGGMCPVFPTPGSAPGGVSMARGHCSAYLRPELTSYPDFHRMRILLSYVMYCFC